MEELLIVSTFHGGVEGILGINFYERRFPFCFVKRFGLFPLKLLIFLKSRIVAKSQTLV